MFVTEKLKTFSWVNIANPDHDDFEELQNDYEIDEDTISDILDPDEQPRLEHEDDYKVIIVRFPIVNRETSTAWHTEPLSIIFSNKRVITVCRKRCDILDRIKAADKESPEEFILNILYYIAESYLKFLKQLNKKVFDSKKMLSEKIRKKELLELLEVENSYTLYMAGLKGNIAVLDKVEKLRGFLREEENKELAEDTRIELTQAIEVVTSYSKMLRSIKDTFESITNIDNNNSINRLTMWNIILMVPTIIVGYYGMNMYLPGAESHSAALMIFVLIMLLIVSYAVYIFVKLRK